MTITTRHKIAFANRRNRRGAIFVVALAIVVILASMALVLAQSMRTESSASANRLSYAQADAVEQGAEMWVLAQTESYPSDSTTITSVPAEAIQIGNGWFWILAVDPLQSQTPLYGITDESSKLNINSATADQLINLPGMSQDVAQYIVAWVGSGAAEGTDSSYYNSLPEPYQSKSSPYETVEELNLIQNVTPQLLYGQDLNRNGVIELAEQNAGGGLTLQTGVNDTSRGFINDLTCYSLDPNTTATGSSRVNVNTFATSVALQTTLSNAITQSRATEVINRLRSQVPPGQQPRFTLGTFYVASGMTPAEFGKVFDLISAVDPGNPSANKPTAGRINVNTASQSVLACLPGLQVADAQTLFNARAGADRTNLSWFFNALAASPLKIGLVANSITGKSYQYSADIVAVSGDGRAFKRVRIVVDSTTIPAKILYRKDLSSLGWPLNSSYRTAMRAGNSPPDSNQVGNGNSMLH